MCVSRARVPHGIVKSLVFFVLVGVYCSCKMYMLFYEDCSFFDWCMHDMDLFHCVVDIMCRYDYVSMTGG